MKQYEHQDEIGDGQDSQAPGALMIVLIKHTKLSKNSCKTSTDV